MSPEQVSGRDIDNRSDLFSFGIVLYELIAGRTPFRRDSEGATLKAIVEDMPEPLARYKSDVPERLQQIVSKLLEKDKELRYQSAEDIIADLKRLLYDSQPTYYRNITQPKPTRSKLMTGIAAVSMLGIIATVVILFGFSGARETQAGGVPRIAVLPFENLGSPDDEYFADGMTEEITSRLAGIQGLGVISRTSAIKYKNTDESLSEIGHELGVDYILEGTVRWSKVGDKPRVRITPQLIRVSDDRHLWADNYERDLMQVFEVQADIAMQIVNELGLTLLDKSKENLERKLTDDPQAYSYYLKAVSEIRDPDFQQDQTRRNLALLDSAIALDPNFAMAYAYRSITQSWYAFGVMDALAGESDQGQLALENAKKALQLEPGLPEGYLALGMYYNLVKRNYDRALDEFSRAQAGMPNDADLLSAIAIVHWRQGNFSEAQDNFRRAIELDPLTATNHWELANCLNFTRDYDEALKAIDRAILLQPDRPDYYATKLDILLGWHGDLDELRGVIVEASGHVKPVAIVAQGYWQFNLVDISLDSVLSYFQSKRDSTQSDLEYYSTVAMTYMNAKQEAFMSAYCDSIRLILEEKVKQVPDEYGFHEGLGLAYACLGDYDAAIQEGETAMELMSVDDCHW
jgi:TolB-like protein/cytochrome c-type biogenesis protein CcmH/NrfG